MIVPQGVLGEEQGSSARQMPMDNAVARDGIERRLQVMRSALDLHPATLERVGDTGR
jgi:hypothetical protein